MTVVSVVVPAYNAATTIGSTLEALAGQDLDQPFEIIVVDDGSDDETVSIAEGFDGPVQVLHQEHEGPGPARNRGAAAAAGQVLAFTDADCIPAPDWLRAGLAAVEDADLVQGAVEPDPSASRFPIDRTVWVVGESGLYETANLFVRRELFERLGGFEDWLEADVGKPLAEDVWFGWRARRAGARTAFSREALVHHAVFEIGVGDLFRERRRLVHFPALAARIPELREEMFFGRIFLSHRTASFDAAIAGVALALLSRRRAPLLAAGPYGWSVIRRAAGWRRHAPRVAIAEVAGDAIGLASLLAGSVRSGSPVL